MDYIKVISLPRLLPIVLVSLLAASSQAAVDITHDAIEKARSGTRIAVETEVTVSGGDGGNISQVRTYFRADNDGRWHFVPMELSGSDYRGILPAPDIHTEFIRYQLLAVTGARELVKSKIFNIEIVKDEETLARINQKSPTDVKIDVSDLQDAKDIYDELQSSDRVSTADKQNIARSESEATPDSRVDVRSEYNPLSDAIPGFNDYINLSYIPAAESFGATAGIVSGSVVAGPAAKSISTAAVSSGGSSTAWLLGGLAVAGGAAAASSGGGSSSNSDSNPAPPPPGPTPVTVTDFGNRWTGPQVCSATGDAAFRWVVDLSQDSNDEVTGIIAFHECPGGGRATYSVTGTATSDNSIQLAGSLTSSQGPLGGTAPGNQTFTVSVNQPPNPNFAP